MILLEDDIAETTGSMIQALVNTICDAVDYVFYDSQDLCLVENQNAVSEKSIRQRVQNNCIIPSKPPRGIPRQNLIEQNKPIALPMLEEEKVAPLTKQTQKVAHISENIQMTIYLTELRIARKYANPPKRHLRAK